MKVEKKRIKKPDMTYNILLIQLNIILAANRERGKRTNPIPPKILATLCCIQARRLVAQLAEGCGGWWLAAGAPSLEPLKA